MISKELLEEITGEKVNGVSYFGGNSIHPFIDNSRIVPSWNIYELAHKCKE